MPLFLWQQTREEVIGLAWEKAARGTGQEQPEGCSQVLQGWRDAGRARHRLTCVTPPPRSAAAPPHFPAPQAGNRPLAIGLVKINSAWVGGPKSTGG